MSTKTKIVSSIAVIGLLSIFGYFKSQSKTKIKTDPIKRITSGNREKEILFI